MTPILLTREEINMIYEWDQGPFFIHFTISGECGGDEEWFEILKKALPEYYQGAK